MDFGVPREVRDLESRVGLSPAGVFALTRAGHTVYIETGAGTGAGFSDENYRDAGGTIVYSAQEAYGRAMWWPKLPALLPKSMPCSGLGKLFFLFCTCLYPHLICLKH